MQYMFNVCGSYLGNRISLKFLLFSGGIYLLWNEIDTERLVDSPVGVKGVSMFTVIKWHKTLAENVLDRQRFREPVLRQPVLPDRILFRKKKNTYHNNWEQRC